MNAGHTISLRPRPFRGGSCDLLVVPTICNGSYSADATGFAVALTLLLVHVQRINGNYPKRMQAVSTPVQPLIANPYIVGRPLTGEISSLYVGREDVFSWFHENLVGATRPNALLLYGRRRIGKTSTLYQLVDGERGRYLRENSQRPIIPIYVDLQRFAGRPTGEWLRRLSREICNRANVSYTDCSIPDHVMEEESAYTVFDRCLDQLEQSIPSGSLLLLALDEFEQIRAGIDAGALDLEILPFLRSQIQHRSRIAFVLCGSGALLGEFWWPIVDLAARCELTGLDHDQTEILIRTPLDGTLDIEPEAVELIWQHTGGHPYLIQSICHRLVGQANRNRSREAISPDDVIHVIAQMQAEPRAGDVNLIGVDYEDLPKEGALP